MATSGYKWLQVATHRYKWLQWPQVVKNEYKWLQMATSKHDRKWLRLMKMCLEVQFEPL